MSVKAGAAARGVAGIQTFGTPSSVAAVEHGVATAVFLFPVACNCGRVRTPKTGVFSQYPMPT